MPELQITPPFTNLDVDAVEAWMIWPDDAARREEALNLSLAKRGSEVSNVLSRSALESALTLAACTPRAEELRPEVLKRVAAGAIAGTVFRQVVKKHRLGIATSLNAELEKAGKMFAYRKSGKNTSWPFMNYFPDGPLPNSLRSANDAWRDFKPVAHLWAAFLHLRIDHPTRFPCGCKELEDLLAVAAQFLEAGRRVKLRRSAVQFGADDPLMIASAAPNGLPKKLLWGSG